MTDPDGDVDQPIDVRAERPSGWAAVKGDPGALRAIGWAWLACGLPHLTFHAAHRQGFSTMEWAASMTPLTFVVLGAAMLVIPRRSGGTTATHPTPTEEKSR